MINFGTEFENCDHYDSPFPYFVLDSVFSEFDFDLLISEFPDESFFSTTKNVMGGRRRIASNEKGFYSFLQNGFLEKIVFEAST